MILELSPAQLQDKLSVKNSAVNLLDVREPDEYEHCHIQGSINVPASEILHQLDDMDQNKDLVLICHHGIRSRKIGSLLASRGFDRIFNLKGGIDAWSIEVDASVPRY